ncbi:MAG: acyl-CoA synthetase [Burkholderiaceae bacterium]
MALSADLRSAYRDWTRAPERGSPWLIKLIVALARSFPRRWVTLLLYPIVAYFVVFSPRQAAASRHFLTRALRRAPRQREVFDHYLTFARMVLDRVYWLSREPHGIRVQVDGQEAIEKELAGRTEGALILSAHLGSFEALRGAGELAAGRRIRPVMYVSNASKMHQVLDAINPQIARDAIMAGRPGTMIAIKDAIARGDLVGILADRSPLPERTALVSFMGEDAPFPIGAYRLAALLNAPIYFACAVLVGDDYRICFERMEPASADMSVDDRKEWVASQAALFARHLEFYARAYPFNWFNFYDFWQEEPRDAETGPDAGARES